MGLARRSLHRPLEESQGGSAPTRAFCRITCGRRTSCCLPVNVGSAARPFLRPNQAGTRRWVWVGLDDNADTRGRRAGLRPLPESLVCFLSARRRIYGRGRGWGRGWGAAAASEFQNYNKCRNSGGAEPVLQHRSPPLGGERRAPGQRGCSEAPSRNRSPVRRNWVT